MSNLGNSECNEWINWEISTFIADTIIFVSVLVIALRTSFKLYSVKSITISISIFRMTVLFLIIVVLSMFINTLRVIWSWIDWDNCQFLYTFSFLWRFCTWISGFTYTLQFPALIMLLYIRLRTVFKQTIYKLSKCTEIFYTISIIIIICASISTFVYLFDGFTFIALQIAAMVINLSSVIIIIIFIQFITKLNRISQTTIKEVGDDKFKHLIIKNTLLTFVTIIGSLLSVFSIALFVVWGESHYPGWTNIYGVTSTLNMFCNTLFVYLSLYFNQNQYKILCNKCHMLCFRCFDKNKDIHMISQEIQSNIEIPDTKSSESMNEST